MIAARSPPRDHLSFSAISLYQSCPLRFYFHYLLNLPEHVVSASLVTGSALHHSLDLHFRELLIGHPPPTLDVLLDAFWDVWRNLNGVEVRFNKREDINDVGRLADRILRAFQASDLARPEGTIIGVEEPLRGVLVPGIPDLVGRIDLIVETEEAVTITDFKSARSAWSQEHVEDAAGQLLLYHELAKPLAGGKPIRLQFMVLTKTKLPEIALRPVEPDPEQIERTKRIVERIWRAIDQGHVYPVPSPLNCSTCPYRAPCRAWTG